jgi:hypothetical protein
MPESTIFIPSQVTTIKRLDQGHLYPLESTLETNITFASAEDRTGVKGGRST